MSGGQNDAPLFSAAKGTKASSGPVAAPVDAPRKLLAGMTSGGRAIPAPFRILRGVVSVSACIHRNAALDRDGADWSWGARRMANSRDCFPYRKDLPDPDPDQYFFSDDLPQTAVMTYPPVRRFDGARQVSCGGRHTLCVTRDGQLWGWGSNASLELGAGARPEMEPEPVRLMGDCFAAFGGDGQSFVIRSDGSLWGWGDNRNHLLLSEQRQCGDPVPILEGVRSAAVGTETAFAVKQDGTLWAWGRNCEGVMTGRKRGARYFPTCLMDGVKCVSVPASDGGDHAFVILENGDLLALGGSEAGSGVMWRLWQSRGDAPIKLLSGVAEVAAGRYFTLIRMTDGRIFAMGENDLGQCGDGKSSGEIKKPKLVFTDALGVAAGHRHGMGLERGGDLWIWGGDYATIVT